MPDISKPDDENIPETAQSNPYLTPEDAAQLIHSTAGTLAKWRSQGKGPVWRDHGNIVYHIDDLHAWSKGRKRTLTRPKQPNVPHKGTGVSGEA